MFLGSHTHVVLGQNTSIGRYRQVFILFHRFMVLIYKQESRLAPIRLASHTLSEIGKKPVKKAVVVSLPTIESSFVSHYSKGLQGYSHPEYPALRVASEALNATESYLWVRLRYFYTISSLILSSDTSVAPGLPTEPT
jgi:Zn-dependent M16 (insulinase) family peptidase